MAADEAETVFSYVPGQQILPTYIVEDGLQNGANVYLGLWDMQSSDCIDCTVQRLSTEQHDRHITGRMAGTGLHNSFRLTTAVATSGKATSDVG